MRYISVFFRAVGWNWVRVPGLVFGILPVSLAIARQYDVRFLESINLSANTLILFSVGVVVIWFLAGLLHYCVTQERKLEHFERAYDRSGRHLLPIKEAMELIQRNLADQMPVGADEEKKRKFAANKLREFGHENQMAIWGKKYHQDEQEFEEFNQQIPPSFWVKNQIDSRVVYSEFGLSVPQTITDERHQIEIRVEDKYGSLGVSKYTLAAMCPPLKS